MVSLDNFKKIELKVGKIIKVERIDGSEKLLKLKVDLGEEDRQIVAGLGQVYQPDDLLEKQVVVVTNLEYKTFMGIESQGMLLAAGNNTPILLQPDKEVDLGTIIR